MMSRLFLILPLLFIGGCSDGDAVRSNKADTDHVWKEQTDTIDRAKGVEQMILDSAEQQRRAIEGQGG